MRKLTSATAGALALLLAACDSENRPSSKEVDEAVANAEATAKAVTNQAAPAFAPPGTASPLTEIPASFQGRWGMVPNDCDRARSDAKGLMEVTATRLSFYESRATPTSIVQATPEELGLQLAFSGEGQTWERTTRLKLEEAGTVIVREEREPPATFRYTRCPA